MPPHVVARSDSHEAIHLSPCQSADCFAAARNDDGGDVVNVPAAFQALEPGGPIDADLALQAERLHPDRVVGSADQQVAVTQAGGNDGCRLHPRRQP